MLIKRCFGRSFLSLLFVISLTVSFFSGCGMSSKHLEMSYAENNNEGLYYWEDAEESSITTWDNADIIGWDDIDDYSDWVYSVLLFQDIAGDMPIIETRVLDYQSNCKYFDGEKIYQYVGDKFDVNSFLAKYAAATGVILVCILVNVALAGAETPLACFIAAPAQHTASNAIKSAFKEAVAASFSSMLSGDSFEDAIYNALESSADGILFGTAEGLIESIAGDSKWGAMFGVIDGDFAKTKMNKKQTDRVLLFPEGSQLSKSYPNGVSLDADGYPILDEYARETVKFGDLSEGKNTNGAILSGNKDSDVILANEKAGLTETPFGYTWFYCRDLKTMQLVPEDIYSYVFNRDARSAGNSALAELWEAAVSASDLFE